MFFSKLFKKKKDTPSIDINLIPECVLLFPNGKEEMGDEILYLEKILKHNQKDFAKYFVIITNDLFFDNSLREETSAIANRILKTQGNVLSESEAYILAEYILKRIQATTPEQKFKYIGSHIKKNVEELGGKIDVPLEDINNAASSIIRSRELHKYISDDAFADLILNHCKFIIYQNDIPDKEHLYGWIEKNKLNLYKNYPTAPQALFAMRWLAQLCSINESLYYAITNNNEINIDLNISYDTKSNYITNRIQNLTWDSVEVLNDVYSHVRRYMWFCQLIEQYEPITTNLIANAVTNKQSLNEQINRLYSSTENINPTGLTEKDFVLIMLRDVFAANNKEK